MTKDTGFLKEISSSRRLNRDEAMSLIEMERLSPLLGAAAQRRDLYHGQYISYSRKVFIPLTKLCRDVCHYCTFAHPPKKGERAYLSANEVLAIAHAGKKAGCKEALFTLGDKPELRYQVARKELASLGHQNTISYLAEMSALVIRETGLLPHLNPGLLTSDDLELLRTVSASQGIMLEGTSSSLGEKGAPHYGSPDKNPALRLDTIRRAGERSIPFTTGLLIGIGETRAERIEALLALRDLNDKYGHLQELIIQNFQPKPNTRMAQAPAPSVEDHMWTIAVARLLFDPEMNIQAPPNLSRGALRNLVDSGINDWGGVSPVTPDHVNPEAPWPHLSELAAETQAAGKVLVERLSIYPRFARQPSRWLDPEIRPGFYDCVDGGGWARCDDWNPGRPQALPSSSFNSNSRQPITGRTHVEAVLERTAKEQTLDEQDIVTLFGAREADFAAVCHAADDLRRRVNGDIVSYVVTRNINYTNICYYKCQFCAFSKGKMSENLRGRPYDLSLSEIVSRVREAWHRGATEVCMQGGIHPSYTGEHYLSICKAVKEAVPQIHMHAFSPLEVSQGAKTLGLSIKEFLLRLKTAGLDTLPGTAAEILDDDVRVVLCPDKIKTQEWLNVMRTAHGLGFKSTATIMFGHVDGYEHWARHLIRIRDLQCETGGFTEFVPLPFVHMEAPIYLKRRSRPGPTFRESVLMHAVARLVLHPHITNIQASWVKLGPEGARYCFNAGVNDLGGTLMDESISRSAGAGHGQEMSPERMDALIRGAGRTPRRRTTVYADATARHEKPLMKARSLAS